MKQFMMIFVGTPYEELGLSPEELQGRMAKWWAWGNKMKEAGVLRGGDALHAAAKKVVGPNRTVSDGPFAESKEIIGGYYTVEVERVEDVIKIAEDYPDYDLDGGVEIREVMVFDR